MHRVGRLIAGALAGVSLLALAVAPGAAQTSAPQSPPDTTRANKQENRGPTAGQQKEGQGDRELTRKIRRALTEDKSLSTYGKNVKIITQDGKVTLKGPVRSEADKKAIEAKAAEVAGEGNVTSEITIAARGTS
jgi:osmotically-inducible protein OsmY